MANLSDTKYFWKPGWWHGNVALKFRECQTLGSLNLSKQLYQTPLPFLYDYCLDLGASFRQNAPVIEW